MDYLSAAISNTLCSLVTFLHLTNWFYAVCYDNNVRTSSVFITIGLIGLAISIYVLKSRRR